MNYLAAVDLSDESLLALDALRALAGDAGGDVTLLHVVDLDLYTAGGSVPGIMEFATERLEVESQRLFGCGLSVSGTRVEQGDSTATILRIAAEENADLVVMTNLGKGARTGRVFGSTAERVAAAGSVPVLIERLSVDAHEASCRLITGSPFDRVLVAVDFDADPESMLRFVTTLPDVGALRVVHVAKDASSADAAHARMAALVAADPGVAKAEADVVIGEPAAALLEAAASWNATAVVLSPCSHGALHRALWGSVARTVALDAACSVLFVPPSASAPSSGGVS